MTGYACDRGHVFDKPAEKLVRRQTWDSPAEFEDCCPECSSFIIWQTLICKWCREPANRLILGKHGWCLLESWGRRIDNALDWFFGLRPAQIISPVVLIGLSTYFVWFGYRVLTHPK